MDSLRLGFSEWLQAFKPTPIIASRLEKILSCLGAFLGLMLTERLSMWALGESNVWFIAPMGASAVLLFGVPSSPLAQPWSIVGGNLIAAFIGVTCALLIPDRGVAAGLSVGLAIALMFLMRCLHPPSGAVALTAVLGGPAVYKLGYSFLFYPVAVNSLALMLCALILNKVFRRNYPHRNLPSVSSHLTKDAAPSERLGLSTLDLEKALLQRGEAVDIGADDLLEILTQAEILSHQRRFGNIQCFDIMSKDVIIVRPDSALSNAWQLMMKHRINALPVVNERGEIEGIITLHDFIVSDDPSGHSVGPRTYEADAPVAKFMTRNVVTARPGQPIAELIPLFSDRGFHHIPVIDRARQVLGMITQSDLVGALFQVQILNLKTL